jgi:hypothetical protein
MSAFSQPTGVLKVITSMQTGNWRAPRVYESFLNVWKCSAGVHTRHHLCHQYITFTENRVQKKVQFHGKTRRRIDEK